MNDALLRKHMIKKSLPPLWQESIDFFGWENFKVFVLATLNTFKRTVLLTLKYFWWMFACMIILQWFGFYFSYVPLLLLLSFLAVLTARPSVEPKNIHYFLGYAKKLPGYLVIVSFFILGTLVGNLLLFLLTWFFQITIFSIPYFFLPLTPVYIAALFFGDAKNSLFSAVQSVFKSNKLCYDFFPVVIVFILFERLIFACLGLSVMLMSQTDTMGGLVFYSLVWIFVYLLTLLPVTALAIYYTKIKHNHFSMFF
jgi:hypothetical protein